MDSRKLSPQGKKLESHLSQEHRRPPLGPTASWGQPSTQSSAQQGLQTQDWVSRKPCRRRQAPAALERHIDERRRLAMRRPGAGSLTHPRPQDIVQMVAQLVSEDVDKDVLFPHPLRSTESTNAFQAFLARSAPFWHNATFEARASRSPPS
uniref:Testis expressed 22 n=1 Tax=Macaca nemestrina TaxID=9545 RepID=A0A2K6D7Y5_MACNE